MEFGLYVSPKEGRAVPRFGAPRGTYIGARRAGKQLAWDEERIVAIPTDEYRRFRAEYDGAIADGSLHVRTAEEYQVQQKARREAAKQAAEAAKPADVDSNTEAERAARVRAIAETAPTLMPPANAERTKAFLLGGQEKR